MAIDLAALKARLAAANAASSSSISIQENKNGSVLPTQQAGTGSTNNAAVSGSSVFSSSGMGIVQTPVQSNSTAVVPTVNPPASLGTAKTTEIDHLDFISKMNSLATAIHSQHPTMPVLLMQIHKQLRADPELVTTLDEDAIGIIVRGLQIQTKTELVAEATKTTKKKKNPAVSVDMF